MKLKASGLSAEEIPLASSSDFKAREEIIQHSIHLSELRYGRKFGKVVYFGDGAWDYVTSRKLGLKFIGLDVNQDDKLKKLGAEHVFENYNDAELIERVLKSFGS